MCRNHAETGTAKVTESEVKSAFKLALGVGRRSAVVFVGVERREADRVRRFTRVR